MFVSRFAIGQSETASPRVKPATQRSRSGQDQASSCFQESSRFAESCKRRFKMLKQSRHHHSVKRIRWQLHLSSSDVTQHESSVKGPTRKTSLEPRKAFRTPVKQSDRINARWKVIQQLAVRSEERRV